MLPRHFRFTLRQQPDFFLTAPRFTTRLFVWYYQPAPTPSPQLAVIVPKKKIAKTVQRNWLKRRVHEVLYRQRENLPLHPLVLYWKAPLMATPVEIETDLLQGLKKLRAD